MLAECLSSWKVAMTGDATGGSREDRAARRTGRYIGMAYGELHQWAVERRGDLRIEVSGVQSEQDQSRISPWSSRDSIMCTTVLKAVQETR